MLHTLERLDTGHEQVIEPELLESVGAIQTYKPDGREVAGSAQGALYISPETLHDVYFEIGIAGSVVALAHEPAPLDTKRRPRPLPLGSRPGIRKVADAEALQRPCGCIDRPMEMGPDRCRRDSQRAAEPRNEHQPRERLSPPAHPGQS